jgi:hypothetical protein
VGLHGTGRFPLVGQPVKRSLARSVRPGLPLPRSMAPILDDPVDPTRTRQTVRYHAVFRMLKGAGQSSSDSDPNDVQVPIGSNEVKRHGDYLTEPLLKEWIRRVEAGTGSCGNG